MGHIYDYGAILRCVPEDLAREIKSLDYNKKTRCIILLELGVNLTLEDVQYIKSLKNETQLSNYARKLIFSC